MLVIEAGYDTAELVLSQRDDDEGNEGEEYIELSFSLPSIGSFQSGSPTRFRIPVLDDDLPPITLALEADKRILDEGKPQDSTAVIARVDAPAAQEISLDYQLGGSAVADRDFKVRNPRLVIPQGQREGRLSFTVIPNTTYQGLRDVQIVFPRRAGITFRGDTKFELQIEDEPSHELNQPRTRASRKYARKSVWGRHDVACARRWANTPAAYSEACAPTSCFNFCRRQYASSSAWPF